MYTVRIGSGAFSPVVVFFVHFAFRPRDFLRSYRRDYRLAVFTARRSALVFRRKRRVYPPGTNEKVFILADRPQNLI